jgi:hypothetical protein
MISFKYGSHLMDMSSYPLFVDMRKPKGPLEDAPSLDTRRLGAVTPPRKSYSSGHTIAPAYNKGGYQVISKLDIKDIGK